MLLLVYSVVLPFPVPRVKSAATVILEITSFAAMDGAPCGSTGQ